MVHFSGYFFSSKKFSFVKLNFVKISNTIPKFRKKTYDAIPRKRSDRKMKGRTGPILKNPYGYRRGWLIIFFFEYFHHNAPVQTLNIAFSLPRLQEIKACLQWISNKLLNYDFICKLRTPKDVLINRYKSSSFPRLNRHHWLFCVFGYTKHFGKKHPSHFQLIFAPNHYVKSSKL